MGGRDGRMAEWMDGPMNGWTEGWEDRRLCVSEEGGWLAGRMPSGGVERERGLQKEGITYPLFSSQTESEEQKTLSDQSPAPIPFLLENQGQRSEVLCPRARREVQAQPALGSGSLSPRVKALSAPHPPEPDTARVGGGPSPPPPEVSAPRGPNKLPLSRGPWARHTGALSSPPLRPTGGAPT